ncbi:MAG: hypothetical protein R3C68_08730 [Myxococcota bacterium]
MKTDSMHATVRHLQQFLSETAKASPSSLDVVRDKAAQADFPYPELAAQVYQFLQKQRTSFSDGLSMEEISEAFMAMLMDSDAMELLGAGKTTNPWRAIRNVIRHTGKNVGASLIDLYNTVRKTGLGYTPTINDLAHELGSLCQEAQTGATTQQLKALGDQRGLAPWQMALLFVWLRRRKKGEALDGPTELELEELFGETEFHNELAELAPDGPWEVYRSQSEALVMLRHFGRSLVELADASS